MAKKTIIFHLNAQLPDMFYRLPWLAPLAILPVSLYRYFSFGKNFQEFILWAVIAFLIPGLTTLVLNSINNKLSKNFSIQIDSQGILYLTQDAFTTEMPVKSILDLSLLGQSRGKYFVLKKKEGQDTTIPWPYEISPEELSKFKDSLKVFGSVFKL